MALLSASIVVFVLACLGLAAPAAAAGHSFAVIYNNYKNDHGFNESAVHGIDRFEHDTGVPVREQVIQSEEESVRAMRRFAGAGIDNIVLIGFVNEHPVSVVAPEFPDTQFTLIDGVVDRPNVRSVLFREDEAGYLVGVAAGLKTRTGKVGFVGAIPIPPILRYECGFVQGVARGNAQASVLRRYLPSSPHPFNDRDGAVAVAHALAAEGADILFPAAGLSGLGALDVVAEDGLLGIGVDVDQDGLYTGHMLTSAVKRVDIGVYDAFKAAFEGRWTSGIRLLGLAEDGVGWAHGPADAFVEDIAPAVDAVGRQIANGAIRVTDYRGEPACKHD